MGDRKFFAGFGYDRRHEIDAQMRRDLCAKFTLEFTEQDFTDMAHAVDTALGAYEALQSAPSPKELVRQWGRIRDAAHLLETLLDPPQGDNQAGPRMPPEHISREHQTATEAADRVMHELRFGSSLPLEMSEANEEARIKDVETFLRVLRHIPVFCELLSHPVEVADRERQSWMIISERGAGHLAFLLQGLGDIAERHGKPTRYTQPVGAREGEPAYSFLASLALCLGQMLPEEARPDSEAALIALMKRQNRKRKVA